MSTQKPTDRTNHPGAGLDNTPRQVVGLVANGSSGSWDIAIDETISGRSRWLVQIEGPRVYLYFEIPSPKLIDKIVKFIERHIDANQRLPSNPVAGNDSLRLGNFGGTPVALAWDGEDQDRCFFTIGTAVKPTMRVTLFAGELDELAKALRQVRDDLVEEGLL